MKPPKENLKKGYITLIAVIVVLAIASAIATSLLLLGIGSSRSSLSLEQSNQSKALANACSEQALQEIRNNPSFSGSGNLNLGSGSCTYTVQNLGGESRLVNSSGLIGTIIRKVKINLNQINPKINISSWQEVADF